MRASGEPVITAELREVLREGARAADSRLAVSEASVAALRESGLLAMMVPQEHGGWGWDAAAANAAIEEVAHADPSVAIMLYLHCAVVARIDAFGSPAQCKRWFEHVAQDRWLAASAWSEPGSTADKRVLSTTAVRDSAGDWVVTGGKTFATSATVADFLIVLVQLPEDGLAAPGDAGGYGGSSQGLVLIPASAPGVNVPQVTMDMAGMRGSGTGMAEFRDVVVSDCDLLCQYEQTGPAMQLPHTLGLTLGAVSVGAAQYAFDLALRQLSAKDRLDDAEIRVQLARLAVTIEAARSMVGDLGAHAPYQNTALAYAVKVFASTTSQDVCAAVRSLLGSAGYLRGHEINRVSRDCDAVMHMGPPNYLCLSVLGGQLGSSWSGGARASARSRSSRVPSSSQRSRESGTVPFRHR